MTIRHAWAGSVVRVDGHIVRLFGCGRMIREWREGRGDALAGMQARAGCGRAAAPPARPGARAAALEREAPAPPSRESRGRGSARGLPG